NSEVITPLYSLKGIKRVSLEPGKSKRISFSINPEMLEHINEKGESVLLKGQFAISLSGSLPGKRAEELGAASGVKAELELR
ncbi:MAG: fibronectin type III-like domain-contianing protein, partial [Calditrichota bacterium]